MRVEHQYFDFDLGTHTISPERVMPIQIILIACETAGCVGVNSWAVSYTDMKMSILSKAYGKTLSYTYRAFEVSSRKLVEIYQ